LSDFEGTTSLVFSYFAWLLSRFLNTVIIVETKIIARNVVKGEISGTEVAGVGFVV
jgi:hypothetical protein